MRYKGLAPPKLYMRVMILSLARLGKHIIALDAAWTDTAFVIRSLFLKTFKKTQSQTTAASTVHHDVLDECETTPKIT